MDNELAVQSTGIVAQAFGLCVGLGIGMVINAVVAFLLVEAYKGVPSEHQKIEPGKIWLIIIPIFNAYWNFMVWPKVSESYQSYFASAGTGDGGDCGRQMAMVYCGLVVFGVVLSFVSVVIPFIGMIGCITGPVCIVLLVLLLIKFFGYKKVITAGA